MSHFGGSFHRALLALVSFQDPGAESEIQHVLQGHWVIRISQLERRELYEV
jgi:hypothetical protein